MSNHDTIIETFNHAGCEVEIHIDPDPLNPREDYDNIGTMVCFHRNYMLGDEHGVEQCRDDIRASRAYLSAWDDPNSERYRAIRFDLGTDPADLYQTALDCKFIVLPLYLYDHSGLTMNTTGFHCPWDSGQAGFIYVPRSRAVKEWGNKVCNKRVIDAATRCLKAEVETYDQYLRGEVYGYVVRHEASGEEDSCWGFFGEQDYVESEARNVAEALDKFHRKARQARLATMIRNHVPLDIRQRELGAL